MSIDNKSVSSWVRQTRYRAKKHNIFSDLGVQDVADILSTGQCKCSYCGQEGQTLDCPFPLKDGGPHVPANVVPCCKACKKLKGTNDLVWLFSTGKIDEAVYMSLLEELFGRRGGDKIKEHVRRATGMIGGE